MEKEELRVIPKRNYLILGLVIVVTLILVYYFYMWSQAYKEKKLNIRILDSYMEVINYNELDNFLVENPDVIVYVSVLENSTIREFEKKLKKSFRNHEIENEMFYLDITEDIRDDKIKANMINNYKINSVNMTNVPCLLIFEEGKLKTIYSVRKNGYDIEGFTEYVNNIRFASDGEIDG